MDRWKQYLFEEHSEAELRSWAKRLKFFRFFRAYGGHANDGDALNVAFAYQTTSELESFLTDLGIEIVMFDVEPPQPELWVSYCGDVLSKFPSLISGTTWMEQPGHCKIMGVAAFVWGYADRITISLSEDYKVSEKTVVDAEKIEIALAGTSLQRVDPPKDTKNCICPKYYPDYFQ
jgi:hypothetical protein